MSDFRTMEEVLRHEEGMMVVDLIAPAMSIDQHLVEALNPYEPGFYLPGLIEPTFKEKDLYYTRWEISQHFSHLPIKPRFIKPDMLRECNPIPTLIMMKKIRDDIFNHRCELVATATEMTAVAKYLKHEPSVPAMAVRMAIGIIQTSILRACRYATPPFQQYRPENLIRPGCESFVMNDEYHHAFEKVLDQVNDFIGRDNWNLYNYNINGTVLIITKGIDYRIMKYYESVLKEEDDEAVEDDRVVDYDENKYLESIRNDPVRLREELERIRMREEKLNNGPTLG